jgi:CHAT domain-containing protein
MRNGRAAAAIANWEQAESIYGQAGSANGRFDSLINLANADESLGKFDQAQQRVDQAALLLPELHSPVRQLTVLVIRADLDVFMHRYSDAEDVIGQGLALSQQLRLKDAEARLQNALGNLCVRREQYAAAMNAYKTSASMAGECGDHVLRARALTNGATVAELMHDSARAVQFSHEALPEIATMGMGREKLTLLLSVGQNLESPLPAEAEKIYEQVAADAAAVGDQESLSYALGYQGRLCFSAGRRDEALRFTRRAAFIAQSIESPQALYRWQWQTGRILAAQGNLDGAIAAYEDAITALETVRLDLTLGNGNSTGGSFRQNIGPIYYELADLLLRRADKQADSEKKQVLFGRARQVVEALKSAQLEDYFQDRCEGLIKARSRPIGGIDPHTAVIYFICFSDRTEMLINIGNQITRFTVKIDSGRLRDQVLEFRENLEDRTTRHYLRNAQTLYDWLLRPIEPMLHQNKIDTLVFVPDGPLRTIPLAALHDGDDFLIARYAIAVSPGLTLMDPWPIQHRRPLVLEAGLSKARFGFPPLTFVPQELSGLKQLYSGHELLDESFVEYNLRKELLDKDYTIVHIASHVEFGSNAQSTYLITYHEKLNLDEIESLILPTRFRDRPLELLTLSCCNTAADDDRSAQGMAGVAIQAGARSAVATLWPINDVAASLLIEDFYAALHNDPNISKAKAMQHAQLKLLQDRRFRHPEYWAPYLVIGNWL